MQHLYRATFESGEVREQIYARELTHAWRVTYTRNGAQATKYGFSGSREKAEKATKLPKACTDIQAEIVHAMKLDAPAKTTSAKPKKARPFAKGDKVFLRLHGTDVPAIVASTRGDKATLRVTGILNDVRVSLLDISKPLNPIPLAQAA